MPTGQEKEHPKGVTGRDLGVSGFLVENFCFRMNSVNHQEHGVTQKVLGVVFCFFFFF